MGTRFRVVTVLAVAAVAGALFASPPSAAEIGDGGFESGTLVDPPSRFPVSPSFGFWTRLSADSTLVAPPGPVHSGSWALSVDTTEAGSHSYALQDFASGTRSYVWTFWVRPDVGRNVAEVVYNWDRSFGFALRGSVFHFLPNSTLFQAWDGGVYLPPPTADAWHAVRVVANRCTGVQAAFLDGSPWGSIASATGPPVGVATMILGDAFVDLDGRYYYDDVTFDLFDCASEPATECPRTVGFWKTHPEAWPVDTAVLGNATYSEEELLSLLRSAPRGDASVILVHQLIAAKLNVGSGADPAPVRDAVAEADALLAEFAGRLPYGVRPPSSDGRAMTALAGVLDDYNRGKLTPDCDGHPKP